MKKSELLEAYNKLKAEQLQMEREASKVFRIFSPTNDGIYIAEGIGKELKVVRRYKFKGYDGSFNVKFDFKEEITPER